MNYEGGMMKDENGKPEDLRVRTKAFALRVIRLYAALPKTTAACLHEADVQLAQLRHTLRLCADLNLLTLAQYEHAAALLTEMGKLLGAWQKTG